ncbi:MAG: carbohydrate-binding protein, partial [Bacteroidales bacterium]
MKHVLLYAFLSCTILSLAQAQRGRVQIQNGTVVTDKGTLLRGCYDRYWRHDFTWEDLRQDISAIKNLGLNCLKMYAGGAGPDDLEDWVPYIDSLVKWTREDSLYFVITPSWYRNIGTEEEPNYKPDIDFIRRYWSFYAERYKDETHMIFDICNEPEERSNYDTLILQMQLDAYDSIRAHAPETHIMFFSSVYSISIDSVFNWLKEIDKYVDWCNASVAMHGYCYGVSEEVRGFNQQMIDSGYTLIITEFESVLHPAYAGRALIRVFEEQEISYLNFLEADVIADHPEYFKTMIERSEIRWTPDFGTWPESLTLIDYYDPFQFRWSALYDEGKGWYFGPYPSDDQEYINNNDYSAYYNLNFDDSPATFEVMCSSDGGEGEIEIHLDSLNGPVVGTVNISNTGGWNTYEAFSCDISTPFTGIHKIYLVYKSTGEEYLFNVRAWYFGKSDLLASQTPFKGDATVIPGKIEIEEYDFGGPTISFLDMDTANQGSLFRDDEVDIDTTEDGGYCVAWTGENEWMEYTVSCEHYTAMDIQVRAACWESGNKFNIKLDNAKLATVYLDSVGSYQDWQIITIENIEISAGEKQILRIELLGGNFNIDRMNFVEHVPTG